ncbi:MAG: hypothetical protein QM728_02310 [Gordonia sp. (in: high G+C Gram-positive bacteria)]|uniref:hypothetical protein n=1 Tax=Gordonia sp. (in: high G+C Gram-positive bacteria) TaxID=84139 RepID=UPI0039E5332A
MTIRDWLVVGALLLVPIAVGAVLVGFLLTVRQRQREGRAGGIELNTAFLDRAGVRKQQAGNEGDILDDPRMPPRVLRMQEPPRRTIDDG